jgi:hypothetical protein
MVSGGGGQMTSAKVRSILRKYQMPEADNRTTRPQDYGPEAAKPRAVADYKTTDHSKTLKC